MKRFEMTEETFNKMKSDFEKGLSVSKVMQTYKCSKGPASRAKKATDYSDYLRMNEERRLKERERVREPETDDSTAAKKQSVPETAEAVKPEWRRKEPYTLKICQYLQDLEDNTEELTFAEQQLLRAARARIMNPPPYVYELREIHPGVTGILEIIDSREATEYHTSTMPAYVGQEQYGALNFTTSCGEKILKKADYEQTWRLWSRDPHAWYFSKVDFFDMDDFEWDWIRI